MENKLLWLPLGRQWWGFEEIDSQLKVPQSVWGFFFFPRSPLTHLMLHNLNQLTVLPQLLLYRKAYLALCLQPHHKAHRQFPAKTEAFNCQVFILNAGCAPWAKGCVCGGATVLSQRRYQRLLGSLQTALKKGQRKTLENWQHQKKRWTFLSVLGRGRFFASIKENSHSAAPPRPPFNVNNKQPLREWENTANGVYCQSVEVGQCYMCIIHYCEL